MEKIKILRQILGQWYQVEKDQNQLRSGSKIFSIFLPTGCQQRQSVDVRIIGNTSFITTKKHDPEERSAFSFPRWEMKYVDSVDIMGKSLTVRFINSQENI